MYLPYYPAFQMCMLGIHLCYVNERMYIWHKTYGGYGEVSSGQEIHTDKYNFD